jgi:uncharacterized RDD family membrane protein YckC
MPDAIPPGTPIFVRRFLAYVFDVVPITFVVFLVFYFFLGYDEALQARRENPDDLRAHAWDAFKRYSIRETSAVLWVIYCSLFEASPLQATPGKYLQGLHVVNWDGSPISVRQAWVRNVSKFISIAAVLIGFVWGAFDKHGQTWHDKIANTYVVRR